jgi:hypothetical protein
MTIPRKTEISKIIQNSLAKSPNNNPHKNIKNPLKSSIFQAELIIIITIQVTIKSKKSKSTSKIIQKSPPQNQHISNQI